MKLLVFACVLAVSWSAPVSHPGDDDDDNVALASNLRTVYVSQPSMQQVFQPVSYAATAPFALTSTGSQIANTAVPTNVVFTSGGSTTGIVSSSSSSDSSAEAFDSAGTVHIVPVHTVAQPAVATQYVSHAVANHVIPTQYVSQAVARPAVATQYVANAVAQPAVSTQYVSHTVAQPAVDTQYVSHTVAQPAVGTQYVSHAVAQPAVGTQYVSHAVAQPAVGTQYVSHAVAQPAVATQYVSQAAAQPAVVTQHVAHAQPTFAVAEAAAVHNVQPVAFAAVPSAITYRSQQTVELPAKEVSVPVHSTSVHIPVEKRVQYGVENFVAGSTTTVHKPKLSAPAIAAPQVFVARKTYAAPEVTVQNSEVVVSKSSPNYVEVAYDAGVIVEHAAPEYKQYNVPTPVDVPTPVNVPQPYAVAVPTPVKLKSSVSPVVNVDVHSVQTENVVTPIEYQAHHHVATAPIFAAPGFSGSVATGVAQGGQAVTYGAVAAPAAQFVSHGSAFQAGPVISHGNAIQAGQVISHGNAVQAGHVIGHGSAFHADPVISHSSAIQSGQFTAQANAVGSGQTVTYGNAVPFGQTEYQGSAVPVGQTVTFGSTGSSGQTFISGQAVPSGQVVTYSGGAIGGATGVANIGQTVVQGQGIPSGQAASYTSGSLRTPSVVTYSGAQQQNVIQGAHQLHDFVAAPPAKISFKSQNY